MLIALTISNVDLILIYSLVVKIALSKISVLFVETTLFHLKISIIKNVSCVAAAKAITIVFIHRGHHLGCYFRPIELTLLIPAPFVDLCLAEPCFFRHLIKGVLCPVRVPFKLPDQHLDLLARLSFSLLWQLINNILIVVFITIVIDIVIKVWILSSSSIVMFIKLVGIVITIRSSLVLVVV